MLNTVTEVNGQDKHFSIYVSSSGAMHLINTVPIHWPALMICQVLSLITANVQHENVKI
jgi:hypothetical protein